MKKTFSGPIMIAVALLALLLVPAAHADRVPAPLRTNTVSFLFQQDSKGGLGDPLGTCFFVRVDDQTKPRGAYLYLVTAKHVITNGSGGFLDQVIVRSFVNGNTALTWFELSTNSPVRPYAHPRPGVDLVVVPVTMGASNAISDACVIGSEMLTTQQHVEKFGIREGDDMFFMGFFSQFYGRKSNIPIYRFGRLAMLTQEEIEASRDEGPQNYYLMEADCFPGNSGSPAFFYFDAQRNPGDTAYLLAGVVTAHFNNASEIKVVERTKLVPYSVQNNGITLVVPAFRLLELFNIPELKAMRGESVP